MRGLSGLNWEVIYHVTDPYEGFPSESCIYASWLDVLVYGGGNRRQRETKTRDREWR